MIVVTRVGGLLVRLEQIGRIGLVWSGLDDYVGFSREGRCRPQTGVGRCIVCLQKAVQGLNECLPTNPPSESPKTTPVLLFLSLQTPPPGPAFFLSAGSGCVSCIASTSV